MINFTCPEGWRWIYSHATREWELGFVAYDGCWFPQHYVTLECITYAASSVSVVRLVLERLFLDEKSVWFDPSLVGM